MITSIHNPRVQRVRDLLEKPSARKHAEAYVIEGVRLMEEAILSGHLPVEAYYSGDLNPRGFDLIHRCTEAGVAVEELDPGLMRRISDTDTPQGILGVMAVTPAAFPAGADFVVILDAIRDPGNMGTILRTAAAAGARAVLVSADSVDIYSPKVLRSGMGAHFHIPVLSLEWDSIKATLVDHMGEAGIYISDVHDGRSLWECDLVKPACLVISNEANGASPAARSLANAAIHIPMPGGFESLNASTAAAILCFEVVRQRQRPAARQPAGVN